MVVHSSFQLLSSLSYILNATSPTCNQIDNACSVTSQCLSTQHLVGLTAYRTGQAISVVEGGACEAPPVATPIYATITYSVCTSYIVVSVFLSVMFGVGASSNYSRRMYVLSADCMCFDVIS